jgi:hypothetical protein
MVAADEHHLEMGTFRQRPADELIEPLLRWNGGIDRIVYVAGDNERVSTQIDQLAGQPVEEGVMLDTTVESMKFLAKMPIRRMDYAHGPHLLARRASHCKHDIIALACGSAGDVIE